MSKHCPKCQQPVTASQQFCVQCGAALGQFRAPAEPTQSVPLAPRTAAPRSSSAPAPEEMAGRVLDGKYRLEKQIGAGGMGAVYLARRIHIGDEVAVKVLHAQYVTEASAVERFRREARAAAMLRHPSVVAIYDFGEARADNPAFIVMELVKGVSLRALLQRERRLEAPRAVALLREICAGVGAAHRHNVVHRDIKPDNIIVCPPEHSDEAEKVKVLDFGIAKLRDLAPDQGLTQTGAVLGTPYYMSPEQCRGDSLDARSDVYSLGAMLYEMIGGQPPFLANTITGVVAKHLTETPAPLSRHINVAFALEDVIMRALAKDPAARQADASELARALQQALQAATPRFASPVAPTAPSYSEPTVAVPPPQPTAPPRPAQTVASPSFNPPPPIVPTLPQVLPPPLTPAEKTAKASGSGALAVGVVVALLFVLGVAAGGYWVYHQLFTTVNPEVATSASPQVSPGLGGAGNSTGNLIETTTATAENETTLGKPLTVSRIESAEALLVSGEAVTEKDLAGFAPGELRILRNTVFARHGRTFESPGLQRYFNSRSWYSPDADYSDDRLSEGDRANLQLIGEAERQGRTAQATTAQSSSLQSKSFAPENTRDDRIDTAWVEGANGAGIGEWIAFTFKPQTVQYIEIYPGYGKSHDLFFANNRLKRATLVFSDGTRAAVQLFDEPRMQTVMLPTPVRTGSLRLIIEEVYAGTAYDDTVIAEINWR